MRDAAKQAGFNQSAFTRWKNGAKADPDFVVKFARAFHLNVLEALVEAEFITENEANLKEVTVGGPALADATNEQLLDEIMRRSDPQARSLFGNEGDEDTVGLAPHLTPVSDADDSMPLSAVAYSGPDEDAERDDVDDD